MVQYKLTKLYIFFQNKLNIQDQIPKYFQAEVKFLTTPCVIMETEKLGPKFHGTMLIIKQFAVHKCSHGKNATTGSTCLQSMIGKENSNRLEKFLPLDKFNIFIFQFFTIITATS